MKKKDFTLPRPSFVCEEELQALVPEAVSEVGTSDDDEDETVVLCLRRRERRTIDEGSRGAFADDLDISETPRKSPVSDGQRGRLLDESPARIAEGSETLVSGRPKETPEDGFKFEFNRGLPLTFHPEDCGRLLQLIKGGPDQLPPVKDLVFKDEYEQPLARLEPKSRFARARKKAEEALRAAVRDKSDAIAREKALRKVFDETRTADAVDLQLCKKSMKDLESVVDKLGKEKADLEKVRAAESLKHTEEMNRLRKSRKYERTDQDVDPTKQTSAGAVVPKDGVVPTIVLTDSPAKASKMQARPHLPLKIPRRKTVFLRVVQKRCLRRTRIRQPQHLVVARVPEREMAAAARILLLSMSETRCLL
ncbi:hypothetical protein F2Q69_00012655 [Brassica cretica]|uniref:Uncharacterized protein n=1 Tax=Brassica cretica TaxID=69181 RepID=A0A8S9R6P7_BRACR|nr:hypothetical protein F2Q69_00012655 [Brassica cretica]